MPAKSKAQAGWLGLIAGGKTPRVKKHGLSEDKAKEMLRGTKVKKLPARKTKTSY